MIDFQYEALDVQGRRKAGRIQADSESEAKSSLFGQGLVVTKLTVVAGGASGKTVAKKGGLSFDFNFKALFEKKLTVSELIIFTQQLRTLYMAGISLPETFKILGDQTKNKHFKVIVQDIERRINEGESLQKAFTAHKRVFSSLYCAMITAGETSGAVPDVLERLIYLLDHDHKTKQRIESALRYPKMVVFAMLGAFLVLLNFVVPQFATLYANSRVELPLPTQLAIALNKFFEGYWWLMIGATLAAVYGWKMWTSTEKGRLWRDGVALKLPIIGNVVQKAAIARFASIFCILQRSGISILSSLDIIRDTVDNAFFQSQFDSIKSRVHGGGGIGPAVSAVRGFTPLAVSLISVGERSGNLEEMLDNLSAHYDHEVEAAVTELTEWIGPILICCLGVVVLFFALAIFLPMWDLVKFVQ